MSRIILETLRETTPPLDTVALTHVVMKERGLDTNDDGMVPTMSKRVGACLRHCAALGDAARRDQVAPGSGTAENVGDRALDHDFDGFPPGIALKRGLFGFGGAISASIALMRSSSSPSWRLLIGI